jgi:predicted membrane chloride channel (bestrophin family)
MGREFSAMATNGAEQDSEEEASNGRPRRRETEMSNGKKTPFRKVTRSTTKSSRPTVRDTVRDTVVAPLVAKLRGPNWLSGHLETSEEKTYTFWERNYIFLRVLRLALVISFISMSVFILRRNDIFPALSENLDIDHPYAAQVFGIVVGFLVITRLNASLGRWNEGMTAAAMMATKWSDAQQTLMAFLHAEKVTCNDPVKMRRIHDAQVLVIHYFSLLHAVCLTSLANTQGQLYGKLNETSQFSFEAWDYLEYPGTRRGPGGTNELYEYAGSMQDWNDALEHNEDEVNFRSRHGWYRRLTVLGKISRAERKELRKSRRQVDLVYGWVLNLVTMCQKTGVVLTAPPIYSRIYQELSNGMLGFTQASRVACVPFPDLLCKTSYFSMIGMLTIIPFIIEQFSQSYVLTPLLTFFVTFGFLMIHCVAIQLEAPFGEDASDLPLLEMHTSFNTALLTFAAIEDVEEECDDIFQRPLDARILSASPKKSATMPVPRSPVADEGPDTGANHDAASDRGSTKE